MATSTGGRWRTATLRHRLASARISGRREHTPGGSYTGGRPLCGEIVAEVAAWPAIITPEDSDRLRALLSNPARRVTTGSARKYLLSGILVCGRCGYGNRREPAGPLHLPRRPRLTRVRPDGHPSRAHGRLRP
ncbi:MAG: hypothetical protein ACREX8_07305 [Gammaproteobacteria bacterium]